MLIIGKAYSKKDIYELFNVPLERQRGAWDTGYRAYEGIIFIFSNVGIPGRTGHDYNNYWDGDLFVWEAKTTSRIEQPTIRKMLEPEPGQKILLFTRVHDKEPFTYEGEIVVHKYWNTTPVKIVWKFRQNIYLPADQQLEVLGEPQTFYEGSFSRIVVNKFERNPLARRMAIDHFGCWCTVCQFDFFKRYGEWGQNYIEVHHIIPIASIGSQYILVPEKDLIPVCSNCHSMIHRKSDPLSISELRDFLQ